MRDAISQPAARDRLRGIAAALILVLVAVGCERSPNANSGTSARAQNGAAKAQPAADAVSSAPALTAATDADPPTQSTRPAPASQAVDMAPKYMAYYFHRTMRCATCLSIEKQSREAIERFYAGELSAGTLEWHAVNIEELGQEHFEKDFDLQTQSLVLAALAGEKVTRWKLLPKVWDLVDNPPGFQEYVVSEVALFIGGG